MQLFPDELGLANLKGEISEDERGFMPKHEAYAWLKELSGKDFGLDVEAWAAWVRENAADRPSKFKEG